MASLNKAMLIGRLGQDPEIRYTQSGNAVANLNIATNDYWTDKNGEKQERTEWHSLVLWGKLADLAQTYLKKGSQLYVEGRIQTRDWENDQGQKQYKTEVVVTTMQFLDTKISENPISKENKFADFSLSMLEEGGTISSFGVEYGHDGKPLNKTMSYQTLGFSLDFLLQNNILSECPKMIKIDVDGIEHLILAGATQTLRNPKCRTVLIEVAYDFLEQSEGITKILTDCGFTTNQSISDYIGRGDPTDSSFNQIWIKK